MIVRCTAVLLLLALYMTEQIPASAQGYDPGAPCGRDENGVPYPCTRPDPNASLEAACQTTARIQNCLPYHQRACQIQGFALACRMLELGRNCYGGDPARCQLYVQILQANTACSFGDQAACAWIAQQLTL